MVTRTSSSPTSATSGGTRIHPGKSTSSTLFTRARSAPSFATTSVSQLVISMGMARLKSRVGGNWNPGNTDSEEQSGSVHYLGSLGKVKPVQLAHDPTTHRMRWVRTGGRASPWWSCPCMAAETGEARARGSISPPTSHPPIHPLATGRPPSSTTSSTRLTISTPWRQAGIAPLRSFSPTTSWLQARRARGPFPTTGESGPLRISHFRI